VFVQQVIPYRPDEWEYPRYPVETLVDVAGDCEDTSILYASILRTLGRGAMLVGVDTRGDGRMDHMAVLAPVGRSFVDAHPSRSFWEYRGTIYAFAETAVDGGSVGLGVDPWDLEPEDYKQIWNVSSVDSEPQIQRVR